MLSIVRKRKMYKIIGKIITSFWIILLILSLVIYTPLVQSQPTGRDEVLLLLTNVRAAKYRIASSAGSVGTIGFQVLGEEGISGENTWKVKWEVVTEEDSTTAILWVSKSTGSVLQVDFDGETFTGDLAENLGTMLLGMWFSWVGSKSESFNAEDIIEDYEVLAYGRFTFGSEQKTIGGSRLLVYKLRWESYPTAPEEYRGVWEAWYAPTGLGDLIVKYRYESLDGSEWVELELLSVELAQPQPLPNMLVRVEADKRDLGPGESAVIMITCTNDGNAAGVANLTLSVDGKTLKSWLFVSKPGEVKSLNYTISFAEAGTYTVKVGDSALALTVSAHRPASFKVSELGVTPRSLPLGESAMITVKVQNTGEEAGSYGVTLKINGQPVSTKTVSLEPGGAATVSFPFTPANVGTYEVDVNGLHTNLIVNEAEEKTTGSQTWLLISAIAVAAAIATGALLLLKTKNKGRRLLYSNATIIKFFSFLYFPFVSPLSAGVYSVIVINPASS